MTPRLVAMIHLPPLPGRPNHTGEALGDIVRTAVEDAHVAREAGFDAVMIQNSQDRPTRERVDAATVAQLTRVATEISNACDIAIGINIHKNDGPAAIAVAAATHAAFVRIKVHSGCVLGAEGLIVGCANETLELRARLGADVQVWADIHDPTSRPLPGDTVAEAARDTIDFGAADTLIVTRPTVGDAVMTINELRSLVTGGVPIVIGGNATIDNAREAVRGSDGIIVGSALKATPGITGRIDSGRAHAFVDAARGDATASA